MTPAEIIEACKALAAKVGPKAIVNADIDNHCGLHGSIYTKGFGASNNDVMAFSLYAGTNWGDKGLSDYPALLAALETKWRSEAASRTDRHTEEIALEIIRLTAEFGECTDAGLRAKFGPISPDVASIAVDRANSMAANGPFSIIAMRGANAA